VCYTARSIDGAFVECFCRNRSSGVVEAVEEVNIRQPGFARIVSLRPLNVAQLHGPGLVAMGATAVIACGAYKHSRPWGRAIWSHPDKVDGIAYASRHDDSQVCYALFDRSSAELREEMWLDTLLDDWTLLLDLLSRYGLGFISTP
jgi:hypothetical protein